MAPPISGILETCLYVTDVDVGRSFYERVFGFTVMLADDRMCAFDVAPGQVLILFKRGATVAPIRFAIGFIPPHDGSGNQHFAFGIPSEALEAWRSHLERQGVAVESEVDWPQGGRSLYFRDPDGNLGELATPGLWTNFTA